MTDALQTQTLYDAFAVITQKGEEKNGVHTYSGVSAESFDDGYSLRLFTRDASVTLGFHNTHKHEFEKQDKFDELVKRLSDISQEEARPNI